MIQMRLASKLMISSNISNTIPLRYQQLRSVLAKAEKALFRSSLDTPRAHVSHIRHQSAPNPLDEA